MNNYTVKMLFPTCIHQYLIDKFNPSIQENEIQFLAATIIIHAAILPLKYLIYKFFVFKDSLNS